MNKDDYMKSLDNIKISPDFNDKTAKLMKEALMQNNKKNPMTKKMVISFASMAIIASTSVFALNYNNLFSSPGNNSNPDNVNILVSTEEPGITIAKTELPSLAESEGSKVSSRMLPLFVYQGRVYLLSNTSVATSDGVTISEDDMLNLRGDYIGKTTGTIDEWSTQEDYATELASTIGESEVYTLKGYDDTYRLMVYTKYEGGFSCEIYDSFGGLTMNSGADYFDILQLKDNVVSLQWESYDSWNNGKSERTDATIDTVFTEFLDQLYSSVPLGDMPDLFTDNVDYDSQKFIYVQTKDNLITSIRLFKEGYVYIPDAGFFQVDQTAFDAFWNTMPVTAPSETTGETGNTSDTSNNTSDNASSQESTIIVTLTPSSYPIGTDLISLTLKNTSDTEIFYGVDYSIEQFKDNTWTVVPALKDMMFIEIAYSLAPNSEQALEIDLSQLNPSLDAGTYRIAKTINSEQFYAEFELTN